MDVENHASGPVAAGNAVGDIPGTEFPKQVGAKLKEQGREPELKAFGLWTFGN